MCYRIAKTSAGERLDCKCATAFQLGKLAGRLEWQEKTEEVFKDCSEPLRCFVSHKYCLPPEKGAWPRPLSLEPALLKFSLSRLGSHVFVSSLQSVGPFFEIQKTQAPLPRWPLLSISDYGS